MSCRGQKRKLEAEMRAAQVVQMVERVRAVAMDLLVALGGQAGGEVAVTEDAAQA